MAFGVYDPARRELCLANAGFPQPLLIRDTGVAPIEVAGVPLGIFPGSTYESVTLHLNPGDVVVFCSDGIHEQTNVLEEEFSVGRLVSRLSGTCGRRSAKHIVSEILNAINEHAGENAGCQHCNDDRTIVVLRVPSL